MPTTYPTGLKVKTIRRYEKGESIKVLNEELHISQRCVQILRMCRSLSSQFVEFLKSTCILHQEQTQSYQRFQK